MIAEVFPVLARGICKGAKFFSRVGSRGTIVTVHQNSVVAPVDFPNFGITALVSVARELRGFVPEVRRFVFRYPSWIAGLGGMIGSKVIPPAAETQDK